MNTLSSAACLITLGIFSFAQAQTPSQPSGTAEIRSPCDPPSKYVTMPNNMIVAGRVIDNGANTSGTSSMSGGSNAAAQTSNQQQQQQKPSPPQPYDCKAR